MDPSHVDIIQNRIKPLMDEVLDGYVIVGYVTSQEGRRTRLVLYNNSTEADGKIKDCAIRDGLASPLLMARVWGEQGS